MKKTNWPEEVVAEYGQLPIWSVTWHEFYVQYSRHQQTFNEAQKLAQEHRGTISLVVPRPREEGKR